MLGAIEIEKGGFNIDIIGPLEVAILQVLHCRCGGTEIKSWHHELQCFMVQNDRG